MAGPTQDVVATTVKEYVLREFLQGEDPDELTLTTELITTGILDSIGVLKMVTYVEEQFSVNVEAHEADTDNFNTIADIARLVLSKQTA